MLLTLMLLALNFDMLQTILMDVMSETANGELGPIYSKNRKFRSWTIDINIANTKSTLIPARGSFANLQYQYNDYSDSSKRKGTDEIEFEPVVNPVKHTHEAGINCDEFRNYALNCTRDSAIIFNSSCKSPPMPAKIGVWCKSIRYLTNCAIDWNSECKDVTESHFNEESIKGHMHVVNNICDDDFYLAHYDNLPSCIDRVGTAWETCYIRFKDVVDFEKNLTQEWTHYATHFNLCCARTKFRRCTLDALFTDSDTKCQHSDAAVLQKFSVIISEGDVFQAYVSRDITGHGGKTLYLRLSNAVNPNAVNWTICKEGRVAFAKQWDNDCEKHMLFSSCPGGDPRPSSEMLSQLMNAESPDKDPFPATWRSRAWRQTAGAVIVICLVKLCL